MPDQSAPFQLLVVDDIEDNRVLINRRFSKRGMDIVEADSGLAALDLIAQQSFDLVLLDIMMPGIDGFEVLRRIRLTHSQDDLPVVMVTARAGNTDIVHALELGANDYVTKPIDFSIAFARVQNQLARAAAQKALAQSNTRLAGINKQLADEIAERQRSETRINHMIHHDALTGLGNRVLFRDELRRSLRRMEHDGSLAVFFIDLASFTLINDTMGQNAGDQLLAMAGERLRDCVGAFGFVARVGSDEFAIIRNSTASPEEAVAVAERLANALAQPCTIDGETVVLHCKIGIAMATLTCDIEPDDLLSRAHMAMHRNRQDAGMVWRMFEPGMDEDAQARRVLEADLRKAVDADQFELHYQPLYNLATNSITGFEALLRWRHPARGLISPAEFIPLAEELGLIIPIGAWVLQTACREATRWPDGIKLAVNISSVQFRSPTLIRTITDALHQTGFAAERLEVEITESLLLDSNAKTLGILHNLRKLGIRISMDDFGTGYSSLSYLRKFPFDKLKIDQAFTRELDGTRDGMAIVRAILALADGLGMVTTAEGVETEAQLGWLRQEGCTEVQGYLLSRPVPAEQIPDLFNARRFMQNVA